MATTNIKVQVDSELKQEAEALEYNGIPFEVKRPTPNTEIKAALDEYEEMKNNPDKYKRYESFDEILDEVFADA